LGAVEAATERADGCHKFIGMQYRRLRRACQAGDAAAARQWMDRLRSPAGRGSG
jgi:DNA-binding FadR family transcriptional regulator